MFLIKKERIDLFFVYKALFNNEFGLGILICIYKTQNFPEWDMLLGY